MYSHNTGTVGEILRLQVSARVFVSKVCVYILCVCLCDHSEELGEYMESKGASAPGILTLTTSLSKPFTRLDRYPTLLKELDRHMEVSLNPSVIIQIMNKCSFLIVFNLLFVFDL